ncbi:endonuclease/exonuclease/phosphatase family protein, partial [Acinetobacter baumannii]|uniref:endonuclease/exonuclease/phosphatase family protein n=1 Tax=Acinetobacter baumannii TaxID=470 RepID=UPI003397B321
MPRASESLLEANPPMTLFTTKAPTRIGTYNVRTMYETGKSAQVANEMRRYRIDLLGISECRWNDSGRVTLASGETVIYSGHEEGHSHTDGVAIMMSGRAAAALVEWLPVSPRVITARFNSKGRKVTVIQCYAPTNDSSEVVKNAFYDRLQSVLTELPRRDIKILMGDMNAKIGKNNTGKDSVMGRDALGDMIENGELLTDFCAFNDLVIGGSIFPHEDIHKATWISPNGRTRI